MRIEEERRKKTEKGRSRRNDPEELKTDPENAKRATYRQASADGVRSESQIEEACRHNKDGLNRLLEELEQLCLAPAHISEIEEQVSMTEELYRATDALQTELEQDLEGEEQPCAMEDWSRFQKWSNTGNLDRAPWLSRREENGQRVSTACWNSPPFGPSSRRASATEATRILLRNSLSTEGKVQSAIDGIPITYEGEILKARFGGPKLVAREHLSALWKAPACREMKMQGIQLLVDKMT
ncbi:hypothetical protein T07_10723 [Trichinella nelsoni]|uniref:Uncharacterized protein n=1 Tax=Trichinella nelsoni TaxID=6336 RepID=A0A0V0RMK7_9BILA|nr:hypothetical protein T07_10723 [Trichinella nelsoni]